MPPEGRARGPEVLMPVKHGPKRMPGRIAGKLTPRQRAALRSPCIRGKGSRHVRYHRRNGGWQSILTFDFFPAGDPPADAKCRCEALMEVFEKRHGKKASADDVAGDCPVHSVTDHAVWHARATTWPMKPLGQWTPDEQRDVKRVLMRLLRNVGTGEATPRKGREEPPMTIHFYKDATPAELIRAGRVKEDK